MNIKEINEETGVIYQIEESFEGISPKVVIDIAYSGNEDEDGNDILEFEWAVAESDSNPELSKEQLQEVNKILECGREEDIVKKLDILYHGTMIKFAPNHYEF